MPLQAYFSRSCTGNVSKWKRTSCH